MSKKIGTLLAVTHIFMFLSFVIYLEFFTSDGQSRLLWTIWLPLDFPVSLAVPLILDLVPKDYGCGQFVRTYSPHFVHGVVGPIWWYLLARFIGLLFSHIRTGE